METKLTDLQLCEMNNKSDKIVAFQGMRNPMACMLSVMSQLALSLAKTPEQWEQMEEVRRLLDEAEERINKAAAKVQHFSIEF